MQKLFQFLLSSSRKRKIVVIGAAIWLLRQVCDAEKDELYRITDKLDEFDWESESASRQDYITLEEKYSSCEFTLGFLESAIEDLEFAY